jgi:hypothetical protein
MSKMGEIFFDIQDMLEDGYAPTTVAKLLECPLSMVYDVLENMEEKEVDCDDSDDGYALASAGFGTDEDYGYYGDEY